MPISEKRRIVERILREGTAISALAREYGVNRHTLYHWQALYRAGKLETEPISMSRASASSTTFLPVTIGSAARSSGSPRGLTAIAGEVSVVELTISSGALLRIEASALSIDLIRALIAELRR